MSLDLKNANLHTPETNNQSQASTWEKVSGSYQRNKSTQTNQDIEKDEQKKHDEIAQQVHSAHGGEQAETIYKESLYRDIAMDTPLDPTQPTVLIIDDDQRTIDTYKPIFREASYNVITAIDGLDGLDKASKIQPELIFTGIIMPRMDGFAMVSALRKNTALAHTPVVMFSHLGRSVDRKRARELDVRDFFVADNISPDEVLQRIHIMMTSRDYLIPVDLSDPSLEKLVKELGGRENIACSDGRSHVVRLRVTNASTLEIAGNIECL